MVAIVVTGVNNHEYRDLNFFHISLLTYLTHNQAGHIILNQVQSRLRDWFKFWSRRRVTGNCRVKWELISPWNFLWKFKFIWIRPESYCAKRMTLAMAVQAKQCLEKCGDSVKRWHDDFRRGCSVVQMPSNEGKPQIKKFNDSVKLLKMCSLYFKWAFVH